MIGGEFPIAAVDIINANNRHFHSPNVYKYSSGRAALFQILKFLKLKKSIDHVLLPDYLCSSILVPINRLGLDYSFYNTDEFLELEKSIFTEKYRNNSAVLLINYFGLKNLETQINIIRSIDEQAVIVEDDVQAYYEFKKPLKEVDFKFTSLRKTFAVPDGGLVKTPYELPQVEVPNLFGQYKAAASLLKSMREGNFNDSIYLDLFEKGEALIDDELESGMSLVAEKLYTIVDEERVRLRRLANASYLVSELERLGVQTLLPMNENSVPLFIPVIMDNRDKVRKAMFEKNIFCPIHWPSEDIYLSRGNTMAEKELSIIVDQRYGRTDMDKILEVLESAIN